MANDLQTKLDAIKLDKDTNLLPENLKAGVTCLGVTGTLTAGENLQEQLNAQDLIIQQLQEEVAHKASGSAKPNIFVQETEPATKDGIWVQGTYQVDNKIAVETVFTGDGEWNLTKMSSLKAIPYEFYYGSAVSIGTNIYLFGGEGSGNATKAYKYDTLTNIYTQLTDIPFEFKYGAVASIGTDIYLLCSTNNYKYDTLTGTYTRLTNVPFNVSSSPATVIGTDIYLFGGNSATQLAYKYDTLTDTYTQLRNIPYEFYSMPGVVSIGTNIYLLGSGDTNASANNYKYDTLTDTYTQLTNIPYSFMSGSAVSIGTNIYLFGGEGSGNATKAYKYDTLTNIYTQLTDIPYSFKNSNAVIVGTDIYLLGGYDNNTKVQVFTLPVNDYGNNTLVIDQSSNANKTKIADIGITDAKFFYNKVYYQNSNGELVSNLTTYNGNGTKWIQI